MSYDDYLSCRIYRISIYPALALLTLACLFGIYTRRNNSFSRMVSWAIGLGLSFSAFWHNREEGVWLLPALVSIMGLTVVQVLREKTAGWKQRLFLCMLPFIIFGIFNATIRTLNFLNYGIFVSCEYKAPEFKAAYGALSRVEPKEWRQYVGVQYETRERIYEASPAFAELRPFLEGPLRGWTVHSKEYFSQLDHALVSEYGLIWWIFAFRDAVQLAGYYDSGPKAMAFYARLADEVNRACDQGKLKCSAYRAAFHEPFRKEYIEPWFNKIKEGVTFVSCFWGFTPKPRPSNGTEDILNLFRDISREDLTPRKGESPTSLKNQMKINEIKMLVLDKIGKSYQIAGPWLMGMAVGCYLISMVVLIKRKTLDFLFLFNSIVFGEMLVFVALIAFAGASWWYYITSPLYLSPCFGLFLLFAMLSIYHAAGLWYGSGLSGVRLAGSHRAINESQEIG
jgi:hypothetical protein